MRGAHGEALSYADDISELNFSNNILSPDGSSQQDAPFDALSAPPASQVQVLDDLSSGGSDDANGMLATNVANVQDTASDALEATLQGSTWQSSVTPVENPNGALTAISTGGQGIAGYQTPITGLHAAAPADGGGVAAVAASIAPASFAPAPAELASPVAGSVGTSITEASVGSGGATTVSTPGSGLVFVNTYTANCTSQYISCIVAAEQTLESLWTNSVTFNITFDEQAAGNNGDLAYNNWPSHVTVSYAQLKSALPASDALPSTDPTGGHNWSLPEAYARMLGLSSSAPSVDDTVVLNSSYFSNFGQDVINTIEHEISEGAMGRVGGLGDQNSAWSTMDLFRYSAPGVPDYTDGRDGKTTYFSTTGSVLSTLSFNNEYSGITKTNGGDTADFTQLDVFGTGSPGETNTLSETDIAMMDALGWNLVPSVTGFIANETSLNSIPGGFAISDTAANVENNLAALTADASHITSITATGGQVIVGNGLFVADQAALNEIVGGFTIVGQASVLQGNLSGLEADISHINSITGLNGRFRREVGRN